MRRLTLIAVLILPAAMARAEDAPITIAAVGDIMLGSTWPEEDGSALAPNDGAALLKEATPILTRADIAFGNLEGPLVDGGETIKCRRHRKGCYTFRMPTRYAALLKAAGFDVLSLANNHALDFEKEGRLSTQAALDAAGIAHSGAVGDLARVTVRGREVVFVAFTTARHSYNLNEQKRATRLIRRLSKEALVIVSFHGGAEGIRYQHVPEGEERFHRRSRGDLRAFAHAMIDAGAAAVIGHGPHVLRAMELYQGHLIAYSLGNFATYRGVWLSGATRTTGVLELALKPDGTFVNAALHPMRQFGRGGPQVDRRRRALAKIRDLSEEDFPATGVLVARDGTITARPPPPPVAALPAPSADPAAPQSRGRPPP